MLTIDVKNVTVSYSSGLRRHDARFRYYLRRRLTALASGSRLKRKAVVALKGVSVNFQAGDVVGIVGENGAGKTTLLRVISKLLIPDSGEVDISGTISTVFNLGAGFMPDLTGRENIYLVGALHSLGRSRVGAIEQEIIEFAELGDSIDRPVKTYSTGMRARLGFSIVAFLDTDIIVLDEALSAGDFRFRKKAGNLIDRFSGENKILVVVSHSPRVILDHCTTACYLHRGELVLKGSPERVCSDYELNVKAIR